MQRFRFALAFFLHVRTTESRTTRDEIRLASLQYRMKGRDTAIADKGLYEKGAEETKSEMMARAEGKRRRGRTAL